MSRLLAKRCGVFRLACLQDSPIVRSSQHFSASAPAREGASTTSESHTQQGQSRPISTTQRTRDGNLDKGTSSTKGKDTRSRATASASNNSPEGDSVKISYYPIKEREDAPFVPRRQPHKDIVAMLSKPTWSVKSLLPPDTPTETITPKQLHHLLRLSALPQPKDQAEEDKMLESLHSQLHFVGDIQSVNTDGVEPLVRIAVETEEGIREKTIGLEDLKHVLDQEVVIGRNKRRRRVKGEVAAAATSSEGVEWDVFKTASETVEVPGSGRYFVVRSGKKGHVISDDVM